MAWTLVTSGTLTTSTSEQDLTTQTTNATYVLEFDANALADETEIMTVRAYAKTLSGGTEHLMHERNYKGKMTSKIIQWEPIAVDISIRFSIQRGDGGTNRSIPWKVLSI